MTERDALVWHVLPARASSPASATATASTARTNPSDGHRCDPSKLLLDPYAKALEGAIDWAPACFSYELRRPDEAQHRGLRAAHDEVGRDQPVLRLAGRPPPRRPYHETVIYEAHVKGLTRRTPDIPEEIRGTYAASAHPAMIEHLTGLGVTAIELMPVHQFVQRLDLVDQGLANYWGYNTIGFFAPHNAYSSSGDRGQQVPEFKAMVRELHRAGIEVILDVVYNHTAEGNHLGPTLAFRGIDNAGVLPPRRRGPVVLLRHTGTGNTLLMRNPHVLQLIMDSLRYWVTEMHVDGFRFDLAASLARQFHEVDRLSAFFDLVQQDPVVSQVKLIAEPWDVGPGGYQVGNFPPRLDRVERQVPRHRARLLARRADASLGEFAARLSGSSDLYESDGRAPYASINFVTAHDGFTLRDLVSYNDKHNEANGEGNNDGESTTAPGTAASRVRPTTPRSSRCAPGSSATSSATLLLSQGVPMLLHGDELGRTQGGNNNAYCQDNEIVLGRLGGRRRGPARVHAARCSQLRAEHPVFRRRRFFTGDAADDGAPRHRLARADGDADGRRRLGAADAPAARGLPQRRRHHRARAARRGDRRRLVPAAAQPRPRGRRDDAARTALRQALAARARHGRPGRTPSDAKPAPAERRYGVLARSVAVLRRA